MGYRDLEAIKIARELPSPDKLEERIRDLEQRIKTIEDASDEEVQKGLGESKEVVLHRLYRELETLQALLPVARKYGTGNKKVNPVGRIVDFDTITNYLCYQQNPERVKRRIHAAVNAMMAKMTSWKTELMKYGVLIVLAAIAVIGVVAAIQMLTGNGGGPVETVAQHVSNVANATVTATQTVANATNATTTTTIPQQVTTITTTLPPGG